MSGIIDASAALRKRKNLKRGINFTVMVVGQSGCGRSTLINSLCGQQVVDTSTTIMLPTDTSTEVPLQLREETVEMEDDEGVKIQLNVVDTPGFGDSLDNSSSFELILDYIRHQYDEILLEESRVRRNPRFKDGRVHCCLYMIVPTGHGLREMDVEFMKQLGPLVNIIPVISKSDSLTPEELHANKKLIMEDIDHFNLPIYNFPFDEQDISEEDYQTNIYLRGALPFAVVGSNEVYELENDVFIRGRRYPWGMLDVEDPSISDFVTLRNTLLLSHLHDLKDYTHEILYERYRTEALSGDTGHYTDALLEPTQKLQQLASPEIGSHSDAHTPRTDGGKDRFLARDEQIRLEEERLRAFEERVQQELLLKRKELLQREQELRDIEERLEREAKMRGE